MIFGKYVVTSDKHVLAYNLISGAILSLLVASYLCLSCIVGSVNKAFSPDFSVLIFSRPFKCWIP